MPDEHLIPPEDTPITISPNPTPLTVGYVQRSLLVHQLSSYELDAVASSGGSLHLTFFGLCTGAAITFAVVLTTANVTNAKTYGAYVGALTITGVLAVYFGIRGVIDYHAAKKRLNDIKRGK
jgi:hypothetical protein